MDHTTITLYLALWAAIGPLVGIAFGNYLTRSSQHTQWLRDRRLEEYKLVLAAVNEMFEAYADPLILSKPPSIDLLLKRHETVGRCFRTMANCVMIADDLKRIDLFQKLLDCQKHFDLTYNTEGFGSDRRYLVNILIKMAHKTL
jgi:hypothetical protein